MPLPTALKPTDVARLSLRSLSSARTIGGRWDAGETGLTSSSGSIDATGLQKPRLARTSSGAIYLGGTFAGDAEVQSSSGSVTLRFAPDSSTRIVARSSSGAITASGLTLATTSQTPNSLDATLGSGAGTLTITTSSGHVDLGPRS